jgi:hypothetical protein
MLEQQETDDQLRVFGRPSDIGKMLPVVLFQLFPRNEVGNLQPTVSLIEFPAEGKKLGKKRDGFAVFALIHQDVAPSESARFSRGLFEKPCS